jgi:hypothetical protein
MLEFETRRLARLTRHSLDGSFGCDRGRKLVVKLLPNDLLEISIHLDRDFLGHGFNWSPKQILFDQVF